MRGRLQGTPLRDKDGNVTGWRVRIKVDTPTGGKKDKGFERKTLKEAQAAAIAFLAKNGRVEEMPTAGTVGDAVAAVKADLWTHLAPHTQRNYGSYADRLSEAFKDRPVDSVTAPQLTAYMKRYASLSKRTMDEHWKVAGMVFGYTASDLGWIDRSPMQDARKPKSVGNDREWLPLTREQFDRVLPCLAEPYRLLYRLLGETGARPSEAWGLNTDERIEFIKDVWWFTVKRGKTEASTRRVPIPDSLSRDLRAAGPLPFAEIAKHKQPAAHLRNVWEDAMKDAGLPYTRPYEVRAMRINEWRKMAIPGLVRRTMVGHTSEKTTNDWYDQVDAAEVLKSLGVTAGVGSGVGEESADDE